MAYFALLYTTVDDYLTRREPLRAEHLARARQAHDKGELILAGAFSDPANGVLFVFRTTDRSIVERFAREDPYVVNGVVTRWEVRAWTVVIGDDPTGVADR